ncbi:TetR/AcrR family transcriptional regulator [Fructobacillus sp. W13]|uniref:TetR/AcrR family transcriptional regulator n=1 Tax=Fructobacillus apis TaxID=2935017 RepID=A0ABT0ZQX3_9LACO|nr:TetR/AcrR family transcriptional regulator [Fructobacillus apis]MCO0832385.1 TetR/AcrR family transcriptional regulator [Fructobacillus apis]
MPKEMFLNLKDEKRVHLEGCLIRLFSKKDLLNISVKDVVEEAGIPRGSFYTYFEDLEDAYLHVLKIVLEEVHPKKSEKDPFKKTKEFLKAAEKTAYRDFFLHYYEMNEPILLAQKRIPQEAFGQPLEDWLAGIAVHQLVYDYFKDEDKQEQVLQRLDELKDYFEGK